jgi:Rrf2 family nitric oxide-sensitive transcriptional repressor
MFIMNQTDRYRLLALLELAQVHPTVVSAARIARARDIPAAYLARLLAELAREGVVVTRRGAGGGIALARPPADIGLGELIDRPTGPSTVADPLDRLDHRLTTAIEASLDGLTVADLLEWELELREAPDYTI